MSVTMNGAVEGGVIFEARHEKTDLKVFVVVIPKEGWARPLIPKEGWACVTAPILLLV